MQRRKVLRLGAVGTLTLFYPTADAPQLTERQFVRNIIAGNQRLSQMMTAHGWPAPETYMGEGIDFSRKVIKKQYAGLTVQTRKGSRFVLVQLEGRDYQVAGVYFSPPELPMPSAFRLPRALCAKNIEWSQASALLDRL